MTRCETCGAEIMYDRCMCVYLLADALQRYLGYDYDHAGDQAASSWDNMSQLDRQLVWDAEIRQTLEDEGKQPTAYEALLRRAQNKGENDELARDATERAIDRAYDNGRRDGIYGPKDAGDGS